MNLREHAEWGAMVVLCLMVVAFPTFTMAVIRAAVWIRIKLFGYPENVPEGLKS